MSKKSVRNLSAEIARIDRNRRVKQLGALSDHEQAFARLAESKGKRLLRAWPDFLVRDSSSGTAIGVVVAPAGTISAQTIEAFDLLQASGLSIAIWRPAKPNTLTPWSSFLAERGIRDEQQRPRGQARPAAPRRIRKLRQVDPVSQDGPLTIPLEELLRGRPAW